MVVKKFITCGCSSKSTTKGNKNIKEFINFEACECKIDGKRLTKAGLDRISLEVQISDRKGFELF